MATETTITDDGGGGSGIETHGLRLLVMSPEAFFSQPLPAIGTITLGRSSKCTVRIDVPLASREHARIHLDCQETSINLAIEDADSANGTRVRDAAIVAGDRVPIVAGEAVLIGSTVVMVLQNRVPVGPRRLWSHAYFESRVEEECARAMRNKTSFALGRIHFAAPVPWTKVVPILSGGINGRE